MDKTTSTYELQARYDSRKSFYGKAHICETEYADFLQSYNTIVCSIDRYGFHKLWDDYSSTTLRHVNEFRKQNDLDYISKNEWDALPCAEY